MGDAPVRRQNALEGGPRASAPRPIGGRAGDGGDPEGPSRALGTNPSPRKAPASSRRSASGRSSGHSSGRGNTPSPRLADDESPAAGSPPEQWGPWAARCAAAGGGCNRRDAEGDTNLTRAARGGDFTQVADLLCHPGADVHLKNHSGKSAHDLLKLSAGDLKSPSYLVLSQALFLRTMISIMVREEHFADMTRGCAAKAGSRYLAERVLARLERTYEGQAGDRSLPFAAIPSLDFIEAIILAMP